jgi:hypothetical protein
MGDVGGEKREFSVYLTAGAWYDKIVLVSEAEVVEEDVAIKRAMAAHPFPMFVRFGAEREPIEIDIVDVAEQSAQAVRLDDGGWRVRLVAHIAGCGTFLQDYADADEADEEGVRLFPGWPDELGDGWSFSQTDYVEVEEAVETEGLETAGLEDGDDAGFESSSPAFAGTG